VRAQVNCLNAVLSAARYSRLSTEMLATLQSDWMSCVQRDSGLFSWSRTLSRERSVGAHRRACPTHRRRFWRKSANNYGTSVSRRTRSRVTCSSGVLATIRHRRWKCTPSRCTASVFEIGHTSALKHITDRTSAQYRRPFTSVAMHDERHRVLRESNTAHAMPQHRLTSGVTEQVGSICVPRYTNSPQGLVLDPSHVNTLIGSTLHGTWPCRA